MWKHFPKAVHDLILSFLFTSGNPSAKTMAPSFFTPRNSSLANCFSNFCRASNSWEFVKFPLVLKCSPLDPWPNDFFFAGGGGDGWIDDASFSEWFWHETCNMQPLLRIQTIVMFRFSCYTLGVRPTLIGVVFKSTRTKTNESHILFIHRWISNKAGIVLFPRRIWTP